jgi:hypothetical protein
MAWTVVIRVAGVSTMITTIPAPNLVDTPVTLIIFEVLAVRFAR